MSNNYSDDKDIFKRRFTTFNDPSSKYDFEKYIADFASFIHYTRCSICDQHHPCLPIYVPFFKEQIFICVECVYKLHEQLAFIGYYQENMDECIRKGIIREKGGSNPIVEYVELDSLSSSFPILNDDQGLFMTTDDFGTDIALFSELESLLDFDNNRKSNSDSKEK